MADPLSVLGAVAAASQLAGSVVKVIEIVRKLNQEYKSPKITRQQLAQIETLVNISQDVKENVSLQTPNVTLAIEKCNQCAVDLQTTLEKIAVQQSDSRMRRLVKSMSTLRKEKEVATLFASLEREKSALHISISNATNLGVSKTNRDVGKVAGDITQILDTTGAIPKIDVNTEQTFLKVTDIHAILTTQHERSSVEIAIEKYYLVPNGRAVKDFVGREDVLELIEKAFSAKSPKSKTVVIRGLGGQGKTQIALEYCRRAEKKEVEAIFWVDAQSENSVKKTFQTISGEIKRPDDNISEEKAVDYVLKRLRDWDKSYLMVFDNYDDVAAFDTIQDFIPDSDHACIIITSRHEKSEELADPDNAIHLEGLVGNESLELLRKTSRLKITSESLDDANIIVNRLGHHPLAITQAGSYIRERKIQLSQFMADYDNRKEEILKYNSQLSKYRRRLNNQEEETVLNVFTTWELSYQLLLLTGENAAEKADLLTLFAFFDCKDISEDLFSAFCYSAQGYKDEEMPWPWPVQFLLPCLIKNIDSQSDDEPCQWDKQAFVTILTDLAQLSLLQSWVRDKDNICHLSLHPLIQDWIRLRIDNDRVQFFWNM